ncbi:helix-turn-helix domain-containing protein [Cytobacillus oceanisediminis]|uniref:helix-turn-helix domain-containing protein n=1 Tax=Cytobacillus oceanisediminis TaxID=665099 RepID=UPI001C247871|nr:helix-turn-helix domain-containing protein [Cytobacillus oceanisediminis]MBU8730772.1 helix-turn-helix domain-containing protein [Cytobacillus oceanisediminis]
MYIESNTIEQLKFKTSVGMRIRIIREYLKNKLGNQFSGNSVANRIEGLTQSSLNMIELGKVKSVSAEVLYYLAKDFGVSYDVFFNDFYLQPNPVIKISTSNKEKEKKNQQSEILISEDCINPLEENEFKINIKVSKVASNGDYQVVLYRNTKEKHDNKRILSLVAQIIHSMNSQDMLVDQENYDGAGSSDPLLIAKELISNSMNNILVFPWNDGSSFVQTENEVHEQAINYTKELLHFNKRKEDAHNE